MSKPRPPESQDAQSVSSLLHDLITNLVRLGAILETIELRQLHEEMF